MTKIYILKTDYSWKIKIGNTVAQQVPTLDIAKKRSIELAKSMKETTVEIYDKSQELLETINV